MGAVAIKRRYSMLENLKDLFNLRGKSALVTGAGSGLGQSIAEGFAQFGAEVALVDINLDAAQSNATVLEKMGYRAIALKCDVTQEDQVVQTVASAVDAFGKIDILAAVAGIGDRNPAELMTLAQWYGVI